MSSIRGARRDAGLCFTSAQKSGQPPSRNTSSLSEKKPMSIPSAQLAQLEQPKNHADSLKKERRVIHTATATQIL
jgi:hypothetical protein